VGAVDDDAQPGQVGLPRLDEVVDVVLRRTGVRAQPADGRARGALVVGALQELLDALLLGVGELVALRAEELDAVVLDRVVARGDHRAGVGTELRGEERDAGRREDAEGDDVAARRADPGDEGGLEHLARRAGVAADDEARPRDALLAEGPDDRAPHPDGELGGELGVRHAADPVGPEQLTHLALPLRRPAHPRRRNAK
jgi:hypothetical protein